jgi:catechol 2,3-dioxygenase-like lactoylglutathione lyase family enzyme
MIIEAVVPLLHVEDIDRSIAFYTTALSFQVAQKAGPAGNPAWALLQCGAVKLMIEKSDLSDAAARRRRPSGGDAVIHFIVDSVQDAQARLRAKRIAIGDIKRQPYGMEEIRLRDPDGYELAIGSPMIRIA